MPLRTVPLHLDAPADVEFEQAPLSLVVCQVRTDHFGAVGEERLRALRERFREQYPLSQALQTVQFEIHRGVEPQAPETVSGYRFASPDEEWRVVVQPDAVALETVGYTRWEDFRERLSHVLTVVRDVLDPAIELRFGLRYVNEVAMAEVETAGDWAQFIRQELCGPVGPGPALSASALASQQIIELDLGDGGRMQFRHGFVSPVVDGDERQIYLLDMDSFREGPRPFEPEGITQVGDRFHMAATSLFQWSVQPTLWERMAPHVG